jgi:DNA replication protein DnaC
VLHQLPPNPPTVHTLTDVERDRLNALYPDLSNSLAGKGCKTCQGDKTFRWYEDDSRKDIVDWECNCEEQFILHRFLLQSGIDWGHQKLSWQDITSIDQSIVDDVRNYGFNARRYVGNGMGLILHGNKGNGKTLLSVLLLKTLLKEGHDCFFINFQDIFDYFSKGFRDAALRDWFNQRIRYAGILVVDDMGIEYLGQRKLEGGVVVHRPMEIIGPMLDRILRSRVAAHRPTIITTNLSMSKLEEMYQSNVISLLRECSLIYEFTSDDYRLTSRNLRIAEINAGLTRPIVLE